MRRTCGIALAVLGVAGLLLALPAAPAGDKDDTLHLFNGKDLSNFYTWLAAPKEGQEPIGKNHDPDKVFTVHDGVLRISGQDWGGLITEKEYEDYHLTAEYKWGDRTWPPREDRARDSGLVLHCVGKEGAAKGGVWMEGIECQMIEGGTGDIILVAGKEKPTLTATAVQRDIGGEDNRHKEWYCVKGAPPQPISEGRIDWYDRSESWKDVKGFRGRKDIEGMVGEWNTLECLCDGDNLTIRLNGTVVNAASKLTPHKGKILIQSEGAEVFFRKIDLQPLTAADRVKGQP
jgi:hypothetical protein